MKEQTWKKTLRRAGLVLFVLYMAALIYFLFFADWYGHTPGKHWEYRYNLIPLREIRRFWNARGVLSAKAVFLNLVGNVAGFIPFGFFLPVISRRLSHPAVVILLALAVSASVEVIQLVTRTGCFDVDDILLNTLGAAIGYLICRVIRKAYRNVEEERKALRIVR